MKKIFNIKSLCLSAALLLGLFFTACSEDENNATAIQISGITTINDLNTPITEAKLGDFIAIHGTGLDIHNIDSIYVNESKVDMVEVYTEKDVLYMQVPVKLSLEPTDKVYIYNKLGRQDYPLKTIAPDLKLVRMFNEYTQPGDTIMIYGDFFNLYEIDSVSAVVDFNGKSSNVIKSANNYLTARVPLDVDKNIRVKVKSLKYEIESTCPGRYYDNECMIVDFDNRVPSSMTNVVTDPKDKNRLSGNYLHINEKSAWSSWWYIIEIGNTPLTDDMLDHSDQYVIKCEFYTANQFVDGKIKFFNYLFWDAAPMEWKPSDFVFQNFNRWETITLPFKRNYSGTYPENMYYHSFNMRIEIDQSIARNFAFDNIRVCKKGD